MSTPTIASLRTFSNKKAVSSLHVHGKSLARVIGIRSPENGHFLIEPFHASGVFERPQLLRIDVDGILTQLAEQRPAARALSQRLNERRALAVGILSVRVACSIR